MRRFLVVLAVAHAAFGQGAQVEVANLREDVRGLSQRVAELSLRLEQLERENADLNLHWQGSLMLACGLFGKGEKYIRVTFSWAVKI